MRPFDRTQEQANWEWLAILIGMIMADVILWAVIIFVHIPLVGGMFLLICLNVLMALKATWEYEALRLVTR